MGQTPDENDSFFVGINDDSVLQQQFRIWKQNMYIPLHD